MAEYPDYVQETLRRARDEGQWYCGQPDAAALCFDVLALFPEHRAARELVYELFCDEWFIYDTRVAVQQNIDEWDDRPHQQRRRLALSFRFTSRWEGWDREYLKGYRRERNGPPDVTKLLQEGKLLLLDAYCLGDDECTDYAFPRFAQAIEKTSDPRNALLWVGKQYADLGFFAGAVEILLELVSRFDDADGRRLLAEVRWWRDNTPRLPWMPPAGDGSRYRRMMAFIEPDAPTDEEVIRMLREKSRLHKKMTKWEPVIRPELAALFAEAMPATESAPVKTIVDWSFLDRDDGQPGELPDWVKKQMRIFPKQAKDLAEMHRWTRPIPPPRTPPRRDPNEQPFDPSEVLDGIGEDELDDLSEDNAGLFEVDDDDDETQEK